MLILGQNSDDTGTQLERLTQEFSRNRDTATLLEIGLVLEVKKLI